MGDIVTRLKAELDKKGISIYEVAKRTGIKYELMRRVFCGKRKLLAGEFLLIIKKCDISLEKAKE